MYELHLLLLSSLSLQPGLRLAPIRVVYCCFPYFSVTSPVSLSSPLSHYRKLISNAAYACKYCQQLMSIVLAINILFPKHKCCVCYR